MSDTKSPFAQIDINHLDSAWLEQPTLMEEFTRELADARNALEAAERQLELYEAEIDLRIRNEPSKFGIEKLSEKAVKSAMLLRKKHQRLTDDVIAARHAVAVLQAAVTTLDHRKKALEKLVDLWLAGYFATPKASKHSREAMDNVVRRELRNPKKK